MLLIIGKVVLGNLEIVFSSWKLSNWIAFTIRFTSKTSKNKREIVVDRSLFEDLPALDYDEVKKKKTLWNYFETISSSKRVLSKKKRNRKERGKDETLFEVDTFITAMCIEERDGMLYVFLPPTDYLEDYRFSYFN
jgi:hypothetical protein